MGNKCIDKTQETSMASVEMVILASSMILDIIHMFHSLHLAVSISNLIESIEV